MKSSLLRVGLLGPRGRMGQWITRLLGTDYSEKAALCAEVERGGDFHSLLQCDAVVDFSSPEACSAAAQVALLSGESLLPLFIVGSTGWSPEARLPIEKLAERTPVLMSSNFSTGVLALQRLLMQAVPLLSRLGYAPVLVDTHHRHKKDAPSGTALMLCRTLEESGANRPIEMHSIRAGEIIGNHEITFYGPGDHLVLGHFAQDRSIFARGAIDAALWLHERRSSLPKAGRILSMEDYFKELVP